jgi:hypothetical protein
LHTVAGVVSLVSAPAAAAWWCGRRQSAVASSPAASCARSPSSDWERRAAREADVAGVDDAGGCVWLVRVFAGSPLVWPGCRSLAALARKSRCSARASGGDCGDERDTRPTRNDATLIVCVISTHGCRRLASTYTRRSRAPPLASAGCCSAAAAFGHRRAAGGSHREKHPQTVPVEEEYQPITPGGVVATGMGLQAHVGRSNSRDINDVAWKASLQRYCESKVAYQISNRYLCLFYTD